jgi:transglutaminase-like putative cysteine protease
MIRLDFEIALRYRASTQSDFLLNIHAARTRAQRVVSEEMRTNAKAAPVVCCDPQLGTRMLRLWTEPGDVEVNYRATVDIDHHLADPASIGELAIEALPTDTLAFLLPSRYCESDRLGELACNEFGHLPKGYARVEAIRQWVHRRTRFAIGTSTSATTALDTLSGRAGVCRDFAHLMIALCRALNIPARFVTGIDYGADPALGPIDFHAYVEVFLGDRWYLFDPTDLTPTMGLVRIGTGRDAADVSFATIFGTVESTMPAIDIRAIVDPAQNLAEPQRTTRAVSTAAAASQPAPPLIDFGLRSLLTQAKASAHGKAQCALQCTNR